MGIFLGNGDGTFKARRSYAGTTGPRAISMGDFNGDTVTDLMTVETVSGAVRVYSGNGNGTFKAGVSYYIGASTSDAYITDYDGDGVLDALVSVAGEDRIAVLQGNGNGTFKIGPSLNVGSGPSALAMGDLNGDGVGDIVTASGAGSAISVLASIPSATPSFARPEVNLLSAATARSALDSLATARERIVSARGSIGASMSRLNTAARNITVTKENHEAAAGRIGDADVAEEVSKLLAHEIRQKLSATILTQIGNSERGMLALLLND